LSFLNQEEFINKLTESLLLPQEVIGKVEINANDKGTNFLNLVDIKGFTSEYFTLPDKSRLSRVFIGINEDDLEVLNGKMVKASIILNDSEEEKLKAFERGNFSKLLKCDKDSISPFLSFQDKSFVFMGKNDEVLIEKTIYKYVENKLMEEFELKDLKEATQKLEEFENQLKDKNKLLKEVRNELNNNQQQISTFNKDYETAKKRLDETKNNIEDLKKKKDILNHSIGALQKSTTKAENYLENSINLLRIFGLINQDNTSDSTPAEVLSLDNFIENGELNYPLIIDYIHAFILDKGIYYNRETILDFFALVRAHDFIVLAGKSGVGKTSLVKEFAKAVNGKCTIIPVKPNWMSKEDLLGYYNPIQRQYISTEFLNVLIEAEKHPDRPYFICLDEMNLARVEYYFADFLSKMEERGKEPIQIELYSADIYPNVPKLLEILKGRNPEDITPDNILNKENEQVIAFLNEHYQLKEDESKNKDEMYALFLNIIPKVLPSVRVGDNVHFFGTANIDDSTHYFSPKVLDRVQVLKFSNPFDIKIEELDEIKEKYRDNFKELLSDGKFKKPVSLSIESLGRRSHYPDVNSSEHKALKNKIIKIHTDYLNKLSIQIGWRVIRQICHYTIQFKTLSPVDTEKLLGFNIFNHKILPLISISSQDDKNIIQKLYSDDSDLNHVKVKEYLKTLEETYNRKNSNVSYWDI